MSEDGVAADCPCGGCNYNVAEDRCGDNCNCEAAQTRPPAAESGTPAPGEVGREAARAVSALIDAAERDFRRVYPEPHMLSANLALAVQAQKVLASLLSASPASETKCSTCGGALDSPPCSLNRDIGWSGHTRSVGPGVDEAIHTTPASETRDEADYGAWGPDSPGPDETECRRCGRLAIDHLPGKFSIYGTCPPASETPGPGKGDLRGTADGYGDRDGWGEASRDLRGEVDRLIRELSDWVGIAQRKQSALRAAVEQRTLAELQRDNARTEAEHWHVELLAADDTVIRLAAALGRVETLCEEADEGEPLLSPEQVRAALADPEADR